MFIGIATETTSIHFAIDQDKEGRQVLTMIVNPDDDEIKQFIPLTKDEMKQIIRVLNFLGQEMQ